MTTSPVIPVIVINEPTDAVPMATALVAGGLKVLEVTLRTQHGLQAITDIRKAVPEAIVGAGTVLSPKDVQDSVNAGAQFLVSPGSTPALVRQAIELETPILPGVATPSEVMHLMSMGINHMKFFPAEASGGIAMLSAMHGPFSNVKFCPTGGINLSNAPTYLQLPNVLCIGGSWMLPKDLLRNKNWQGITELAEQAAQLKP